MKTKRKSQIWKKLSDGFRWFEFEGISCGDQRLHKYGKHFIFFFMNEIQFVSPFQNVNPPYEEQFDERKFIRAEKKGLKRLFSMLLREKLNERKIDVKLNQLGAFGIVNEEGDCNDVKI